MPIFGLLSERGGGHVVTAVLIAMVAMLFTAISYGRMARIYPTAGSAFVYVARELHPSLGYITGWSMLMDYILNPLCGIIWCAEQSNAFVPGIPIYCWKIFYAALMVLLNIQAIRFSAKLNASLTVIMSSVVVIVLVAAMFYIFGHPHNGTGFFWRPFYDARTFSYSGLFGCTSVAVLTYIGFDGISTLAEEAENPRRNILLATVLTCFLIGILSAVEVYAAQLVWPASERFPNVDTAYVSVATRIWKPLFTVVGFTLMLGIFSAGTAANLGAARLLYGMGRSGALPKRFFATIDAKHGIPRNNVFLVGIVALLGAFLLTFSLGAEMLNFGALLAFMGVNAAAFVRYVFRQSPKRFWSGLAPVAGFLICLLLWWNLSRSAKVLGFAWLVVGLGYSVWKTRGFRIQLAFEESDA